MTKNKIKEPVRLRFRAISNGCRSLYLDTYFRGRRTYEFLHLYLVPETDPENTEQNKITIKAALAIKSQRMMELLSSVSGIYSGPVSVTLDRLLALYSEYLESNSKTWVHIRSLRRHLSEVVTLNIKTDTFNEFHCRQWIRYLSVSSGLNRSTARRYLQATNSMFNFAVRRRIINSNPLSHIDLSEKIPRQDSVREYLTPEELRLLIETPAPGKSQFYKNAFLFACFCGLRFSDINSLCQNDINIDSSGNADISVKIIKTGRRINLPLSPAALRWLPLSACPDGKIFPRMWTPSANAFIAAWVRQAGIKKHVTFHTSRHTFATLLISQGIDLYTVSRLLGHSNITTTQVYARIVDSVKRNAVNLLSSKFE